MRRQLSLASLIAAVVIAGAVAPASAADVPLSSTHAIEKVVSAKKLGRSSSTRVAAAEWSQIAWHRYAFPLVLGVTY